MVTDWARSEPDDPVEGDGGCWAEGLDGFSWNITRDNCGFLSESSDFAWWDGPCTISSFKPAINATATEVDGCYHALYPFVCATPALPGALPCASSAEPLIC